MIGQLSCAERVLTNVRLYFAHLKLHLLLLLLDSICFQYASDNRKCTSLNSLLRSNLKPRFYNRYWVQCYRNSSKDSSSYNVKFSFVESASTGETNKHKRVTKEFTAGKRNYLQIRKATFI